MIKISVMLAATAYLLTSSYVQAGAWGISDGWYEGNPGSSGGDGSDGGSSSIHLPPPDPPAIRHHPDEITAALPPGDYISGPAIKEPAANPYPFWKVFEPGYQYPIAFYQPIAPVFKKSIPPGDRLTGNPPLCCGAIPTSPIQASYEAAAAARPSNEYPYALAGTPARAADNKEDTAEGWAPFPGGPGSPSQGDACRGEDCAAGFGAYGNNAAAKSYFGN